MLTFNDVCDMHGQLGLLDPSTLITEQDGFSLPITEDIWIRREYPDSETYDPQKIYGQIYRDWGRSLDQINLADLPVGSQIYFAKMSTVNDFLEKAQVMILGHVKSDLKEFFLIQQNPDRSLAIRQYFTDKNVLMTNRYRWSLRPRFPWEENLSFSYYLDPGRKAWSYLLQVDHLELVI